MELFSQLEKGDFPAQKIPSRVGSFENEQEVNPPKTCEEVKLTEKYWKVLKRTEKYWKVLKSTGKYFNLPYSTKDEVASWNNTANLLNLTLT